MVTSVFYGHVATCLLGIIFVEASSNTCPYLETVPDFQIHKFAVGRWYEAKRIPEESEYHGKCVMTEYCSSVDDVTFNRTQINDESGKLETMVGSLNQPNVTEPGKLQMTFPGGPADYWILATDYETYAVVYSCRQAGSTIAGYAWILTRKQNPSYSFVADVLDVAIHHGVDPGAFETTDQTHCIVSTE